MKRRLLSVIILCMLISTLSLSGCTRVKVEEPTTKTTTPTTTAEKEEPKPYVEENNMQITSATTVLKVPAYVYTRDSNSNDMEIPGLTIEATDGSYSFYDYQVVQQNDDGYQIVSFKVDVIVPIKMTLATSPGISWKYTNRYKGLNIFDYYTGDKCAENSVDIKEGEENTNKEFKYTDITFNEKTYKIGVRSERLSSYDGLNEVKNADGSIDYSDTSRATHIYYIYEPKDYDGVMIGLYKPGVDKDSYEKSIAYETKFNELKAQADAGNPSEEYNQMQAEKDKIKKINQYVWDSTITFALSDFYVVRMNDITKAVQK